MTNEHGNEPHSETAPDTPSSEAHRAAPAPEPPEDDRPNMPVFIARYSLIRACVWANATDQGTRYTTTLSRLYLGADDRWHSTQSFGYRDLPLVEKVCDEAFRWIAQQYAPASAEVPF